MAFRIQIKGLDEVRANLGVLRERLPVQFGAVLREECMAIMEESQQQCPVDDANMHEDGSAHLVDTGQVIGPEFENGNISVIMSYGEVGDPTENYAFIQHENMEYHHSRPGTKAKYLEDPANERVPFLATNLVKGIQLEVNGAGYFAQKIDQLNEGLFMQGKFNRLQQVKNKGGMLTGRFA
jgi:hypothetical protein